MPNVCDSYTVFGKKYYSAYCIWQMCYLAYHIWYSLFVTAPHVNKVPEQSGVEMSNFKPRDRIGQKLTMAAHDPNLWTTINLLEFLKSSSSFPPSQYILKVCF
jgi:hypothetical protein